MSNLDRLTLATKFVAALHDVSRRNPAWWRRISAIGARMGIKGDQLSTKLSPTSCPWDW
jgi:hypothetical protein